MSRSALTLSDGRSLDVVADPPGPSLGLVLHTGTPTGAVPFPPLSGAAAERDLRLITWSRPGYGASDRQAGRSVADIARDTAEVLDLLAVDRFATVGWSGGGPHALACAALLPERCVAAAILAGVAPHDAEGLDWLGSMGAENIEEFGAALQGPEPLRALLDRFSAGMQDLSANGLIEAMGDLIPPADATALADPEFGAWMAAQMRTALSTGIEGWLDDDLAFCRSWGVDLSSIRVPVSIWQGDQDRMVPQAHGQWLIENVPGAVGRLRPDEGHLSLYLSEIDHILDEVTSHR